MINEIELSEKFKEIFTDEETASFFYKWENEKKIKEDTRTKIQKSYPIIGFIVFFVLLFGILYFSFFRDRVEQGTFKNYQNDMRFITCVYYNTELVQMWSVPIEQLTDSVKQHHKEAGEALLRTLRK